MGQRPVLLKLPSVDSIGSSLLLRIVFSLEEDIHLHCFSFFSGRFLIWSFCSVLFCSGSLYWIISLNFSSSIIQYFFP